MDLGDKIGLECRFLLRPVGDKTLIAGVVKKRFSDDCDDRLVQGFINLRSLTVVSPPVFKGQTSRAFCGSRLEQILTGGYFATMNKDLLKEGFVEQKLINF